MTTRSSLVTRQGDVVAGRRNGCFPYQSSVFSQLEFVLTLGPHQDAVRVLRKSFVSTLSSPVICDEKEED